MNTELTVSKPSVGTQLSASQLEKICFRLGSSLKAGIPIAQAWEHECRFQRGRTRGTFERVQERLQAGQTLAEAIKEAPSFPALLTEMVRVGEETGKLDQACLKMADHYRTIVRMKRTFWQGVTWPLLQLSAAAAVVSVFFVVLHVLETRISGLVAPDVFMLGLSPLGNLVLFWGVVLTGTLGLFLVFTGIRSGWFGKWPMKLAMSIPLLGSTIRELALSRFAWAFGTAVDAGMNAKTAMQLGLRSTQNRLYQSHEQEIVRSVNQGRDYYTALQQAEVFPDNFLQAVQSGEFTGELTESLGRLSDDYREHSAINLRRIGQISGFGIFLSVGALMGFSILFMYASYLGTLSEALSGQALTLDEIRQGQVQQTTNPIIAQKNEMVKDFVENNEDFKQIESIYKHLGRYNEMTPDEFLDGIFPDENSRLRQQARRKATENEAERSAPSSEDDQAKSNE